MVKPLMNCNVPLSNIYVLEQEKWYQIGKLKVRLDWLTHDVLNNAIHIEFENGYKILYATDTSSLDNISAENYNFYFIDGNYESEEELNKKIQEDEENGVFSHYNRVKETHMSQVNALNWLQKNMGENSEYRFIHQHKEK